MWRRTSLLLACITAAALSASVQSGEKTAQEQSGVTMSSYALEDIMAHPENFMGQEVFFYARFASLSSLYKPFETRLNQNEHINFAVWPEKAELWSETGRKNNLPTLYIAKNNKDLVAALKGLQLYETVAVSGRVVSGYSNLPWILVGKLEKTDQPQLTETAINQMRSGLDALIKADARSAAWHFEQAIASNLPQSFLAAACEYSARANLMAGNIAIARDRVAQAIRYGHNDMAMQLALADLSLKMSDPATCLDICHTAMNYAEYRLAALGMAAEAWAMQDDYLEAFNYINAAVVTPGITRREEAVLDVHRARIYKISGRIEDAAKLYAELTAPGQPMSSERWLLAEAGSFHENQYLAGGEPIHLELAYQAYERSLAPGRAGLETLYKMAELEIRKQKIAWRPSLSLAEALVVRMQHLLPEYVPAKIIQARLAFAKGDDSQAETLMRSLDGKVDGDPVALAALAETYADLGNLEQATRLATQAARLQPWNERPRALGQGLAIVRPKLGPEGIQAGQQDALLAQNSVTVEAPYSFDNAIKQSETSSTYVSSLPTRNGMAPVADVRIADGGFDDISAMNGPEGAAFPPTRVTLLPQPAPASGEAQPEPGSELQPAAASTAKATPMAVQPEPMTPILDLGGLVIAPRKQNPEEYQTSAGPAAGKWNEGGLPVSEVHLQNTIITPQMQTKSNAASVGQFNIDDDFVPEPVDRLGPPPALEAWNGEDYTGLVAFAAFTPQAPIEAKTAPALFTFAPDRSPTIIAGYGSDVENTGEMPIRNQNLYRKNKNNRKRPAEVLTGNSLVPSREPLSPMVAPRGGNIHRAEVLLPGSPQGIGINSEINPRKELR